MIKEIDKFKEPPKLATKFANTVFVLGILYSVLFVTFAIYKILDPPDSALKEFYLVSILLGSIIAILFGFGLRLSNNLKINLSLLLITVGITVYGFEIYLEYSDEKQIPREVIAKQMGVPYDMRTKIEVLEDLNDSGIKAYPTILPSLHIKTNGLNTAEKRTYPLGGISNHTTVLCNESGYWIILESDEHGFNNSKELYEIDKVDIVLTGDSYAEGSCVKPNNNIAAILRESDFNAISVAIGGNGPLIEFAALKEYAEPLKPKIVLWLFFTNDIGNLDFESSSSLLERYLLEDNFSQNLLSRQDEIDSALKNYFREEWARQIQSNKAIVASIKKEREKVVINWTITKKILKLLNLRSRFHLQPEPRIREDFIWILEKSKKMVSAWGGKLYFVYLPDYFRYAKDQRYFYRKTVLRITTELDIPVIDIHKEVFKFHPDPLSLFPFRSEGHYNAEGNRLVAEAFSKRLKDDGFIPSKSNN